MRIIRRVLNDSDRARKQYFGKLIKLLHEQTPAPHTQYLRTAYGFYIWLKIHYQNAPFKRSLSMYCGVWWWLVINFKPFRCAKPLIWCVRAVGERGQINFIWVILNCFWHNAYNRFHTFKKKKPKIIHFPKCNIKASLELCMLQHTLMNVHRIREKFKNTFSKLWINAVVNPSFRIKLKEKYLVEMHTETTKCFLK